MENHHLGSTSSTGPFSIAMLVYPSVYEVKQVIFKQKLILTTMIPSYSGKK